ncbi:MAG: NAD+ synthase [Actinobacteria bacterium]|uniref:NAD(+) synthase (glutamine-hydrolyzing) n=1 Tax=freshwater metagenome TaxID=449393 RepID=A0A6J6FFG9_9ZZZZ|nr:NAD+ synthase [Actinomycetota bacterium]
MSRIRFALAQINPIVGDIAGNARLIIDAVSEASENSASVVAFPEMALTGYPIEDLAFNLDFVRESMSGVDELARTLRTKGLGDIAVVVGYIRESDETSHGGAIAHNSLAVLFEGDVVEIYDKQHLPNYSVFDEQRVFNPGKTDSVVTVGGVTTGLLICEDLWRDDGPTARMASLETDVVLVINASPYERTKDDMRMPLMARRAIEFGSPLLYVNLVGGQDDLVFDGDSAVTSASGELISRAPRFAPSILYTDVDGTSNQAGLAVRTHDLASGVEVGDLRDNDERDDVWDALVLGLRDYALKNGFPGIVLGLSGGIDSAVCAVLAADAVGAANVLGVSMPSKWSSEHSKSDALQLAENIGCAYVVEPIAPLVDPLESQLELTGLAAENVQARIRGVILMAKSNQSGHLVLTTGNKSEVAVGYSTMYGDTVGGFAPLKDVPKTLVWALAERRNERARRRGETPPIPQQSISKPPSAELRPDQTDQDSLPDYATLDAILELLIDERQTVAGIVNAGYDLDVVSRVAHLVRISEWKRRQGAIGPRISSMAFGRERRLPITVRRTSL